MKRKVAGNNTETEERTAGEKDKDQRRERGYEGNLEKSIESDPFPYDEPGRTGAF